MPFVIRILFCQEIIIFMLYIVVYYDIINLKVVDNMFVKQNKSHKGILLTFTIGYRENGKVKHKNIETIGYLEDLKKQYPDPIAHFKEIAKQRSNDDINELIIKNIGSKMIDESVNRKNLGYIILKRIYNELGLREFFNSKQSKLKIDYKLNDIFELLIYSRILYPGSKLENYNNKDTFFDTFDFSLKDLYRSLDYFQSFQDEMQTLLWNKTKDKYNRDTSSVYYDCTNYYFEISYNDEDLIDENGNIIEKGYRKKGPSKEHRKDPIIQMGLLMDKSGIPLSYNLFPGNESEKVTLRPALKKTKRNYDLGRVITVADRGLNTSDNTLFIAGKNDNNSTNNDVYVFGQSVLVAEKEFKDYVLKQDDYIIDKIIDEQGNQISFKHKSRTFGKTIQIMRDGTRKNKSVVYQKQMVYYSEKYAQRQKKERDIVIAKANDLIKNPGRYTLATSYGASKYINNIDYDKKTGEVIAKELSLKLDKIEEEEKFDGYYSIVTSELEMSDKELRDVYKGLWKIEESFKITKSNLESRPVYVWTKEHIEAHFLTCFISLVILRLLEQRIDNKYSTEKIINSLKNYTSTKISHDIYLQDYYNDIIKELEKSFNIDLSKKYIDIKKIKKLLNGK